MNKERRAAIDAVVKRIGALNAAGTIPHGEAAAVKTYLDRFVEVAGSAWADLKSAIEALVSACEDIQGEIEEIKDAESEFYDNMPDGLKAGPNGTASEEAVDALGEAYDTIGEIAEFDFPDFDGLEIPDVEDLLSKLDDVEGSLENASGV
jgi:hypothetical protein